MTMKFKVLVVLAISSAVLLVSCGKSSVQNAKMKSNTDSLSYAFGVVNYNALLTDSITLNPVFVAKAMLDGDDNKATMSDSDARDYIMKFIDKREQEKAKDYIAENESFLAKNKERPEVKVTPSGLQYEVIKMGSGPMPSENNVVQVHYVGTLIDGTKFDSSYDRNEPATFPLSGVIQGWTEALQLMPVGSKFKIYLPESLGYGANGARDLVKPFSTLIFEVELLKIEQ